MASVLATVQQVLAARFEEQLELGIMAGRQRLGQKRFVLGVRKVLTAKHLLTHAPVKQ